MKEIDFAEMDDIKVGHAQNVDAGTGCTVVICERGQRLALMSGAGRLERAKRTCSTPSIWWRRYMRLSCQEAARSVSMRRLG